ncbi:MAG: hypothetical protein M0P77_06530 [Firmicutes bacterium]|nr:hypothetical protein [Bacillota bacterium]
MSSKIHNKIHLYMIVWEYIGTKLKKIILFFFIITTLSQYLILFTIEGLPPNTTLKMEGKAIIEDLFDSTEGEIILKADKIDKDNTPEIIINGTSKYTFNSEFIDLKVKESDIVEIDGINCKDKINVFVYRVSDNIVIPKADLNYQINKNLVFLFRVKMKLM